jgi:hypothetical protein
MDGTGALLGLFRSSHPQVAGPTEGLPARRAADRRICRIAGGAVACWYRMVPDNVKDYRFVRDHLAKTGVKSSQSGNSSQ